MPEPAPSITVGHEALLRHTRNQVATVMEANAQLLAALEVVQQESAGLREQVAAAAAAGFLAEPGLAPAAPETA